MDKKAEQLVNSGLTGINISIDSLDREVFKNITGHDRLPEILHGIANLQSLGYFFEGKYNKYWNREWYDFKFGVNYVIF